MEDLISMTKRIIALLVALMMVVSLGAIMTACGPTEEEPGNGGTGNGGGPVYEGLPGGGERIDIRLFANIGWEFWGLGVAGFGATNVGYFQMPVNMSASFGDFRDGEIFTWNMYVRQWNEDLDDGEGWTKFPVIVGTGINHGDDIIYRLLTHRDSGIFDLEIDEEYEFIFEISFEGEAIFSGYPIFVVYTQTHQNRLEAYNAFRADMDGYLGPVNRDHPRFEQRMLAIYNNLEIMVPALGIGVEWMPPADWVPSAGSGWPGWDTAYVRAAGITSNPPAGAAWLNPAPEA
jgi:hypothetical protein